MEENTNVIQEMEYEIMDSDYSDDSNDNSGLAIGVLVGGGIIIGLGLAKAWRFGKQKWLDYKAKKINEIVQGTARAEIEEKPKETREED